MSLNPLKTECMVITTRQKHQLCPLSLSLSVNGSPVEQGSQHRLLGVTIDDELKWQAHINNVCKKVSRSLYMLSKLKTITDTDTRLLFYNAHIKSHIDYASTVWDGSSDVHLKRLNALHRRAARLIFPDPERSTDQKLRALKMLPLTHHFLFNKGVFVYKLYKQPCPQYLTSFITERSPETSRHGQQFRVPQPRIDIFKSSLSYSGTSFWNSIPAVIRTAKTLASFRDSLFKHLYSLT
jgi:hypothetical protein